MRVIDFINQGGFIMWILVVLNILGTSVILWKFWMIRDYTKKLDQEAQGILQLISQNSFLKANSELFKDIISSKVMDLETGMTMIKVIATISPLLGLLGTVVGIFDAFQVITVKGLSNPSDFAEGISLALITTIGGLIVAIPHFICHNFLSDKLDKLEVSLEKRIWLGAGEGK